ncbi:MAG TPA: ThiF family adenylyltransferase [Thermoplasmata archaeon]
MTPRRLGGVNSLSRRPPLVLARPRTKPSLSPFRLADGTILLARDVFGLGRTLEDDAVGTIWRLLRLMDGSRDLRALERGLRRSHPDVDGRSLRRAVARLGRLGVIEDAAEPTPGNLSARELDRYSRNLDFFSLVSLGSSRSALAIQRRFKSARVTILGMGAIGSATASSLVAAGVGHLKIFDPDRVEASNLNRQLLYRSGDVGRFKVDAAAAHLRRLNPHLRVTTGRVRVRGPSDLPRRLKGCDLFVLGADQPHELLLWTNDAAVRTGTPWLENSYSGARCATALFVPGRTPCLRCLQHGMVARQKAARTYHGEELFPASSSNAVIAPTAAIAGHFGALQALYFLAGLPTSTEGRLVQLNLWRPDDVRVVRARYWPACPACGRRGAGAARRLRPPVGKRRRRSPTRPRR